ncbi:MAG: polysaccharide deacetylase family protein [Pedobacter sp.]|nr:MAG: polysaccharide deacetylase family protein [Pedobacter sp.]
MSSIPITMLHLVDDKPPPSLKGWSIDATKFLLFLDCIEDLDLEPTTFEDIIKDKFKSQKKKVIITFDDCSKSLFDFAIPELIKRKMKAVFYIPSAYIGKHNIWDVEEQNFDKFELFNEQQLLYLVANGMEIGSHGHKHRRMSQINNVLAIEEVQESKRVIEQILGKQIYSFSFPYAEIHKNHKKLLKEAGYHFGVSIYTAFESIYTLRRFSIHQSDDRKSILFKLTKKYQFMRKFFDPLLIFKKFLAKM